MTAQVGLDEIEGLANAGFYIALRIGFAFPVEEVNRFPGDWIETYTRKGLMLADPVIRWVYGNTGTVKWSDLSGDDPRDVFGKAANHGLCYGVVISVFDGNAEGQRSFGSFARSDREFRDLEIRILRSYLTRRHAEMAPPTNLTDAELVALGMVKQGLRLKQIAFELGVSEGAVKQRLKNAKAKLGANTSTQAATIVAQHGLI